MEVKLLTVATDLNREGYKTLARSAEKFGWDLHTILTDWRGFGTKVISVYEYLRTHQEVKNFLFVDAYDVIMLGTPKEFEEKIEDKNKMLIGVEKNCWPDANLASQYPPSDSEWRYINSGAYYSPLEAFVDTFEANPIDYISDDQLWLTTSFLKNIENKVLDYDCKIFQSYSFIAEDDYSYDYGRIHNLKTGSTPIVLHGNGCTNMDKVIELL